MLSSYFLNRLINGVGAKRPLRICSGIFLGIGFAIGGAMFANEISAMLGISFKPQPAWVCILFGLSLCMFPLTVDYIVGAPCASADTEQALHQIQVADISAADQEAYYRHIIAHVFEAISSAESQNDNSTT